MAEKLNITIDGRSIQVEQGKTVLQAALTVGREVPHYCWHPGLSIAGNCRMCLVEVEKAPKLLIACDTRVQDGMVVNTDNARVREARAAIMEFLLINHPLDCPICDQAGECRLQDYAVSHGSGVSRYTEPKLALNKAVDIGRHVMLDQERCIQCSRCIRFCDEVTGTGELAFFQRGSRTVIGVFPERRLDNAYSGNVVDICPVGALTLKEFRFQTRVWYLENTPTICAGCARGCNVMVAVGQQRALNTTQGQQDERIKRIVPRVNEAVNGHWICDAGRLSYQRLAAASRVQRAQSPAGRRMIWDDAVAQASSALETAAASGSLAAVVSPRLSSEDLLAWRLLLERLGGARIAVRKLHRGADDTLLLRADKGCNSTGARWILGDTPAEEALLDSIRRDGLHTLLVLGDTLDPDDSLDLDPEIRARIDQLIHIGPFLSGVAQAADILLPAAAWSEDSGTVVNFEGRVQRLARCHLPAGEGRPGWRVALDLAAAAALEMPAWADHDAVLASLAEQIEAYAGMDRESIGLLGAPGGSGTAAGVAR